MANLLTREQTMAVELRLAKKYVQQENLSDTHN